MKSNYKISKSIIGIFILLLTLTIVIFAAFFGLTYNRVKKEVAYSGEEAFRSYTNNVISILNNFDNTAMQISMLPSTNKLLNENSYGDLSNYIKLDNNLKNYVQSDMYHSISIFFETSGKVYTTYGGLYDLGDFYDKQFIGGFIEGKSKSTYASGPRKFSRPFTDYDAREVISFVHKAPLFGNSRGCIILNVNADFLSSYITSNLAKDDMCFSIEYNEDIIHYTDPIMIDPPSENKTFFSYQSNLPVYGLVARGLLPKSLVTKSFIKEARVPFFIFILIILTELVLAYLLGSFLLSYLNSLIKKIQLYNPQRTSDPLKGVDGLDQALDNLFTHTDNIYTQYEKNIPIFKERAILDLLWNNNFSNLKLNDLDLSHYEIEFPYKNFYVFIAYTDEIDNVGTASIKDQINVYVKENITTVFSSIGNIYSIFLGSNKIGFVLNTNKDPYKNISDHKEISSLFSELHNLMLEELSIRVSFSFGSKEETYNNLHESYIAADNNLIYSSIFDNEFTVFYEEKYDSPVINRIPLAKLTTHIIDRDYEKIKEYINMIYDHLVHMDDTIDKKKELLVYIISSLYIGLWEKGVRVNPHDLNASLSQIYNKEDLTNIKQFLAKSIENLSSSIGFCKDSNVNENIILAINFIHGNYTRDISITEIASHVDLNQNYLNRIFKLSTGKTLSEYLNSYRIEQSKDMLCNTDMTIKEISKKLGYNDVRSYIRFFKKFVGLTPNDYRD